MLKEDLSIDTTINPHKFSSDSIFKRLVQTLKEYGEKSCRIYPILIKKCIKGLFEWDAKRVHVQCTVYGLCHAKGIILYLTN
jgi:hypothetical protein